MANFLRTVLIQNRAEAADRIFQQDLPVNPLSQVLVTLRFVMTAVDTSNPLSDVYATVPALAIRYRGQDILRGSLFDLAVLNAILCHQAPFGYMPQDAAGETFSLTVPINLGRRPYDVKECFPAVRRGDLVLEMSVDTVVGNVDLIDLQVETVELLDETPMRYLKYTTGQQTFPSTGVDTVRLPIGNPLLGVLLFGTTTPTAALQTATWEQLRLKVDNVEALYAACNWATLHGEITRRISGDLQHLRDHAHRVNAAIAGFTTGLEPIRIAAAEGLEQYAYLDFDPLGDGSYMLETAGRADVVIQRDVGTADLGRFIPVELVSIAGAGA
jgi:hypothetical protein